MRFSGRICTHPYGRDDFPDSELGSDKKSPPPPPPQVPRAWAAWLLLPLGYCYCWVIAINIICWELLGGGWGGWGVHLTPPWSRVHKGSSFVCGDKTVVFYLHDEKGMFLKESIKNLEILRIQRQNRIKPSCWFSNQNPLVWFQILVVRAPCGGTVSDPDPDWIEIQFGR